MFHAQQAQALSRQKSDIIFQAQQAKAHVQQAKQRCAIIFKYMKHKYNSDMTLYLKHNKRRKHNKDKIISQAQQAQV